MEYTMAAKAPIQIDEIELINLAKKISPSYYRILGNNLGFGQAELDNFLIHSQQDRQEAIHTILRRWNDRRPLSENSREVLGDILEDTELKAIGDLLKTGHASLFQGSSRPIQRGSTAQSTPATSMNSSAGVTARPTTTATNMDTMPSSSMDCTMNHLAGLLSDLLPRNMQLPQHNSHVYNATSSDTVKVVLTTSLNDHITHVLPPKQYCRIPTPYGRVRLAVYKKDTNESGDFAHDACAVFADNSDRSFIVKKSSDGKNFVVVRSKYGQFRTEER